jgi:hypothetical protein
MDELVCKAIKGTSPKYGIIILVLNKGEKYKDVLNYYDSEPLVDVEKGFITSQATFVTKDYVTTVLKNSKVKLKCKYSSSQLMKEYNLI